MENVPEFYAKNRAEWRKWLMEHHETETGVWLICDKGPSRKMQWADVVQEALCFGWIDGRANKVSDTQSKLYVSKRKPKGMWSKVNKAHIEQLIANGLMTPAGMAAIVRAKENGSWDTLNNSDNLILPPELAAEFKKHPAAFANYEAFAPSSKRMILQWIYDAKTDATRQKRVMHTVESAERGEKAR